MKPDEIEKLLGGYATGTLSAEERKALYEASLGDQKLFEALADEEALRELLSDGGVRARLRETLRPAHHPAWASLGAWIRRPVPMTAAASLATAAVAVLLFVRPPATKEAPRQMASARPPATVAPAAVEKDLAARPAPAPPAAKPIASRPLEAGAAGAVLDAAVLNKAAGAPLAAIPPPPAPQRVIFQEASEPLAAPFRYRLERREADDRFATVTPASTLRSGEPLRLIVDATQAGWLHVSVGVSEAQRAQVQTLFSAPVEAGGSYTVPPAGALPSGPGERTLLVTFSRQPPEAGLLGQAFRARDAAGSRLDVRRERAASKPDVPYTLEIPLRYQ